MIPSPAPAAPPEPSDLPSATFRHHAHAWVDWLADYLEGIESYPVLSRVAPGDVRAALPATPPEAAEDLADALADIERVIVPGLTHWNHPGFMAYFGITGSAPGILGELLAAGFNANGMLWRTSPAVTELEAVALDWLRQLLGLPPGLFGEIQDTASMSTLVALAAAREAAEPSIRSAGMAGRPAMSPLLLYTSEHSHSSVEKAALTLGIGQANVRKVATDAEFRLRPDLLAAQVAADAAAGRRPFAVVATVGTTSVASVDPVPAIADVCARHGLWLHVDAAYGGAAAVLPERRWVLAGCERADSLVVNPHKWLFTPMDCSALYTRRPDVLRRAFSLVAEYLRTPEADTVVNLMDYGPALGRRFRALKLWLVLRAFGAEGIRQRIRHHLALAEGFRDRVLADPGWELMAPVHFSLVTFRAVPADLADRLGDPAVAAYLNRLNAAALADVNADGRVYLSHTELDGRYVLRLAIGNLRTAARHVDLAWDLVTAAVRRLDGELRGAL
jgi:aromatic-L-amino-acid/L-tryptophan decarboxylase